MASHSQSAHHPHASGPILIRAERLGFAAAGTPEPLLADISLSIRPGERVGIAGPSGSGKTTLGLHLAGLHRTALLGHTSGRLWLDSHECANAGLRGFAGVVLQNPEIQLFGDTVEEEIALSLEQRQDEFDPGRELARWLDLFDLRAVRDRPVATLSLGWKQRLSVAGMLALAPKVLLLDEPTSYLDAASADLLFRVLAEQTARDGLTVLLIEHDLARLRPWASRLLGLERGRLVFDGLPQAYPAPALPQPAGHRSRNSAPTSKPPPTTPPGALPLLSVEQVSFQYHTAASVLNEVSFALFPGEIVALTGANGSGKSTLLELIKGLLAPCKGKIRFNGFPQPASRMAGISLVFQNPDHQLFAHTIFDECAFLPRNQALASELVYTRTRQALARVGLQQHPAQAPFSLSYGQKRRLTLASVLSGDCALLCLDEPTVGLDLECLADLAALLLELSRNGLAILLATHDREFVRAVATRELFLEPGGVARNLPCQGGLS